MSGDPERLDERRTSVDRLDAPDSELVGVTFDRHELGSIEDLADLQRPSDAGALARDGVRDAAASGRGQLAATLLASARHELRSPLQSIQGFSELLESGTYGPLSEEQHAFVDHILQGSLELGGVIEACLELAELELAKFPLELAPLDLRSALDDALAQASERTGVVLHTRYGNETRNLRVQLEHAALRRAFHALLTALATTMSASAPNKAFRLDVAADALQARLSFGVTGRSSGQLLSIEEFAGRRRATRSLIWLRLAAQLLGLQDGLLLVTESLDCAEVRFRLSSPH